MASLLKAVRLVGVAAALTIAALICGFAPPTSHGIYGRTQPIHLANSVLAAYTFGLYGNQSPEYATYWTVCASGACMTYPDYWTLNDPVLISPVSGGYNIYQEDFQGILYDNQSTNPAAPGVGEFWAQNFDGSTEISTVYGTNSGCNGFILPSGESLDPCATSNYNTNGHVFSNPNVGGTEFPVSLNGATFASGAGDGVYWVIGS